MIAFLRLLPELLSLFSIIFNEIKAAEDAIAQKQKLQKIKDAVNAATNGDTSSIETLINK